MIKKPVKMGRRLQEIVDVDGIRILVLDDIADRDETIQALNRYGEAVVALKRILQNSKRYRPSHCEWPYSTAHNALKSIGELHE